MSARQENAPQVYRPTDETGMRLRVRVGLDVRRLFDEVVGTPSCMLLSSRRRGSGKLESGPAMPCRTS